MRQSKVVFILITIMALLPVSTPVFAGTGSLRIEPDQTDATLITPATFEVYAQSDDSYDVNFLLVVTVECYTGMLDGQIAAEVTYGGTTIEFMKSDFVEASSEFVPPSGTTEGARYTVASLKDHIDTEGSVYWAMKPMLHDDFDPLTTTKQEITVNIHSSDPRILVYLQGKSVNDAALFDMKVPPTIPGFVVPEIPLGTIMGLATMLAALAIFAKRQPLSIPK